MGNYKHFRCSGHASDLIHSTDLLRLHQGRCMILRILFALTLMSSLAQSQTVILVPDQNFLTIARNVIRSASQTLDIFAPDLSGAEDSEKTFVHLLSEKKVQNPELKMRVFLNSNNAKSKLSNAQKFMESS